MPKSAQKRSSKYSKEENSHTVVSDHDYDGEMSCNVLAGDEEEFHPLPVTPTKPPLSKKPGLPRVNAENNFNSGNAVQTLAKLINSRSDALEEKVEAVRVEMKDMNEKIVDIEKRVERSKQNAVKCLSRVADLESYGRRWNLRNYGLPEAEKEDMQVIGICQKVLPSEREKLLDAIDVIHRVGKHRHGDPRPHGIFLSFISRRHREAVWKAAKKCAFLQSSGLRFAEDLSKEDRENRQKLWPRIKSAQEEGKPAYFVGG